MKHCPRCSSELSPMDKVCPRCGLPVSEMKDFEEKFNLGGSESQSEEAAQALDPKLEKKRRKEEEKRQKKAKKEAEKKQKIEEEEIDFSQFAINSGVPDPDEILDTDTYSERKKKKKKLDAKPRFMIDENGEFDIDTKDVEIVGEETGKIIEKQYQQSYSVKKSRGDYMPQKLKWWEIYKFADRHFARSKIKKEVNKAAKMKPSFVEKYKLLLLCIFLGPFGAHHFYAKNKKRGWFMVTMCCIWILGTILAESTGIFRFLRYVEISIMGFAGFLTLFFWFSDLINIIFNQFKYTIQRDRFIEGLNVETRAKLGAKYIDMDLYHKPWWVRFKVWCDKCKRNHAERQKERRQANIDREKERLKEQAENETGEAATEKSDNAENSSDGKFSVSSETISELETFDADDAPLSGENDSEDSGDAEDTDESTEEEKPAGRKNNATNPYAKKYAKTVKNKKAERRKKK